MKKAFKAGQNDVKLNAIVIIDDIYTTGSTIDAMAAVCRQQGVSEFILRRCLSETDRRSDDQSGKGSQNDQDGIV